MALFTSGYHNEGGNFVGKIIKRPWCDGVVWSINSSPAVPDEVTDFKVKWNQQIRRRFYGEAKRGNTDGEYIDSSEGYITAILNFRREHSAGSRNPLTFSIGSHKLALSRLLIAQEYIRAIAEAVHGMGKLTMANGSPTRVPWLDVMGTQTDWNPRGKWRPMPDPDLLFRRVMCWHKPYCFLMNTNFDGFSKELVEKYMERCLAYGMFPGFFSPNASEGHYFSRPELYERDRPLFKKYIPICKLVAEEGWEPITLARADAPSLYVERLGDRYLTLFNDSSRTISFTLTLDGLNSGRSRELLSGRRVE